MASCKILKIQDFASKILNFLRSCRKILKLCHKILNFQDLASKILKIQDFAGNILQHRLLVCMWQLLLRCGVRIYSALSSPAFDMDKRIRTYAQVVKTTEKGNHPSTGVRG